MIRSVFGVLALASLSACVTTRPATAEQRAYCERMAAEMGNRAAHDHGEMKGQGPGGMNLSHQRCREILASGK